MADLTLSGLSTEYVRVRIVAEEAGVSVDPTADVVEFAFKSDGSEPASWETGSWESDTSPNPDVHFARILVGPSGTVTLADGLYEVWVKVTDSPEVPVKKVGTLLVT